MLDDFTFQVRPRVVYKAGLVDNLAGTAVGLGTRALIVADDPTAHVALLDRLRAGLAPIEVVGVFSDVSMNPSVAVVERGAAYSREVGADLLIAVGSGAVIDAAKCIRLVLNGNLRLADYAGDTKLEEPLTPLIAVPTVAGSGSEVTPFAVIRDEYTQRTLTFANPLLAPDLAILDPQATQTLPPHVTAAAGLDALTHAIEAFVSKEANWISDSLALQAIDTISNNLRASALGNDMAARGLMLIGACMAGIAFANSSLGIVHVLAQTIGASYDVPHGTLNAILLPHGMRFNSAAVPNRFARIARALGVNAGGRAEEEVIEDGITAVAALVADCTLPQRLREVGVDEAMLSTLATTALNNASLLPNPRATTVEEVLAVLQAAW